VPSTQSGSEAPRYFSKTILTLCFAGGHQAPATVAAGGAARRQELEELQQEEDEEGSDEEDEDEGFKGARQAAGLCRARLHV